MKQKLNNNNKCLISWVGKQYEPEIERTFRTKTAIFYRKCIFGALTLEVGNYVLVSNMDSAEPDLISGCDIARIEHMYDLLNENPNVDSCRAIVQWYSRPAAMPTRILNDENYAFDFDKEIMEDSRFNPDISIETIFGLCRVETLDPMSVVSDAVARITTSLPVFIARYRLTQASGSRRMYLEALTNGTKQFTPRKRKSVLEKSSHRSSVSASAQKTPKSRTTRSKSIEFIDVDSFNDEEIQTAQKALNDDKWIVKVVETVTDSIKKKLDEVTESFSEVDISGDENGSPSKIARRNNVRRKTGSFRRNLNASLRCESPVSSDMDMPNYSIVNDGSENAAGMKIKLRLSQQKKVANDVARQKTPRKRSTNENIDSIDEQISPRKTRKSSIIVDDTEHSTPSTRTRRKSILKTPSSKATEATGTPKRNIQLSNIIEEISGERRSSRKVEQTPKKSNTNDEPKTPRSKISKSTPRSSSKMNLIRSGAIKPNIQERNLPIETPNGDQLSMARERLHVSAVPESLPCREKEYNEIYNFLEGKIFDGCGGCMYVSGVPGTGKTATTTAVIRSLQALAGDGEIPKFEFVEINGMRLTEPRQAYVHIYRQLTGKTLAWEQAYNLLNKRFTTKAPRRVSTVLLVDELDILCNKRQDVVYNLLNWPTANTAQLVVITIANTMDLPERLLMGKISSRLGLTRLTFQPYNFRQLQEIVMARLTGMSAFDAEAVQLVARKVAAVSGDARRALDICRRATEVADDQSRKTGQFVSVSMGHVQHALGEMIASAKVQTIKSCSRMEQLFLQAVTAEVARTGIEECNFLGVYSQFEALAAFAGITVPNPGRAIAICSRLGASRLLICENARNDIYQKILLNISSDDVHYALQASNLI
ncbi:origin recognition complex subunit 1 [Toxorhynchites rutilus septentrionalis]|uniref:origin recognition complex subunit 1 n=1 Tax=Toxorhynchites rutilus septentrionalis TaxID=329112 RepID=UPI002479B609|nr:origin recognition complex subunit 1 [Toxorhynchites rutilus septentrionalis]